MSNSENFNTKESLFKSIIIDSQLLMRNLNDIELFKKLIAADALTAAELKEIVVQQPRDFLHKLSCLDANVDLMHYVVVNKIVSFQDLVDVYKFDLPRLLKNKKLFEKLIESDALIQEDLRYLFTKISNSEELESLCKNALLLSHIVLKCSFQELIDFLKKTKDRTFHGPKSALFQLMQDANPFSNWIDVNALTNEDLKYLLNNLENLTELRALCDHGPLIKKILSACILNTEFVDKFNKMCRNKKERNIFELIQAHNKFYPETLELNKLNKVMYVFNLTEKQKSKMLELFKNDEIAQERLNHIVDNHLESQFDFESLMSYLKKQEKKNLINI